MSATAVSHSALHCTQQQTARSSIKPLLVLLNLLASIQVTWFYLVRVTCFVNLDMYEQGLAPTPFQYRLLLMAPLRWAHRSQALNHVAVWLSARAGWFPHGVRPEGLVEAAIDLVSLGVAGLVARALYRRASPAGVLAPYVYPLTLVMVVSTYSHLGYHAFRFPADLPSMALFSCGLLLIYTRAHWACFAAVFLVGTLNRETMLLLLVFFILAQCTRGRIPDPRQIYSLRTLRVALPLAAAWAGWHLWVVQRFAANPSAAQPRLGLNLAILALPVAWPQLLGVFAYLLPPVAIFRAHLHDPLLRVWLWGLPVWFAFMLVYGLFVEVRIFGELIPYIACVSTLIAEQKILGRLLPQSAAGSVSD